VTAAKTSTYPVAEDGKAVPAWLAFDRKVQVPCP
jgi:hypothetical protein